MSVPRREGLARAAFAIAAVTVAARVFGFLRVVVFARTVGTTPLGDAYQTANTLPNILFEIVAGGALAAVVVPVVAGAVGRGDREAARQTAAGLLTWVVVLLAPVALLGAVLGRPLMTLLAGGTADPALRAAKIDVGARMLVLFMPQVVLYGLGIVATGVLQAHRRFVAPALAPLLSSVVVIGCYAAYGAVAVRRGDIGSLTRGEELLLALGTTLGVAVLTLAVLLPLRSLRLSLRPTLTLPPGVGGRVGRLAASGVAAVVAQQLALAVVLRLCNVEPGAVVVYQIAFTLYLLPWAVLAVPIATSAFPALAAAYDAADDPAYAAVAAGSLRAVLLAMALATALLVACAAPLATLVAGAQPSVRAAAPGAIPRAVAAFAPGLVGYGVLALLTRALYARHRARAVAAASVAGFACAAALAVVFVGAVSNGAFGLSSRVDRVAAVGAANSVGMAVAALVLVAALRRTASPAAVLGALRTAAVSLAAAAVAAFAGGWAAHALRSAPALLALVASSAAAVAVFAAVVRAARLPAAAEAMALVRSRMRRGAPA
ncbi:MAG: putative peptidoglycan lipid flippase [Frankiaceae bacterium]|nr:putative peptidoglycan lipid flippase [Frankiaceae bacterium]